jgi:arylsulfatase A-like enzyme
MIASWPGQVPAGTIRNNLIDFTDFLPTLMNLAGARIPPTFHTDGVDFSGVLLGREEQGREWLFCDYAPKWGNFMPVRFVHNGAWKLYESGEIYHTAVDPEELKPLRLQELDASTRKEIKQFQQVLDEMQ